MTTARKRIIAGAAAALAIAIGQAEREGRKGHADALRALARIASDKLGADLAGGAPPKTVSRIPSKRTGVA